MQLRHFQFAFLTGESKIQDASLPLLLQLPWYSGQPRKPFENAVVLSLGLRSRITWYFVPCDFITFSHLLTSSLQFFFCAKLAPWAILQVSFPYVHYFRKNFLASLPQITDLGIPETFSEIPCFMRPTDNLDRHKEILPRRWAIVL